MAVLHGLFGEKSTTPSIAAESPAVPRSRPISMWPLHALGHDDLPKDGDRVDRITGGIPNTGK